MLRAKLTQAAGLMWANSMRGRGSLYSVAVVLHAEAEEVHNDGQC